MENEMQVEAFPKKVWSIMRVFFFMLREGISKKRLSLHLNLMLKRSKIAGKPLGNLMFHHHSAARAAANLFSFYKAAESGKMKHRDYYTAQYETIEEEFMGMMAQNDVVQGYSPIGWSKPIRVTDSPFPVFSGRVKDGECHVDEAADEFIKRFYRQLRRQALSDA